MCRMNLIQSALNRSYLGASIDTLSYINNSHKFFVDESKVEGYHKIFQISSVKTKNRGRFRESTLCQSNIFRILVMPISALENFLGGLENSFASLAGKFLKYSWKIF